MYSKPVYILPQPQPINPRSSGPRSCYHSRPSELSEYNQVMIFPKSNLKQSHTH